MMVHKEHRVTKDKQELMLVKVLKVPKDTKVYLVREHKVLKVLQELEATLVLRVQQVLRDIKGKMELTLDKVHKVLLVLKVLKGIKETKERQALIQTFQLEQ